MKLEKNENKTIFDHQIIFFYVRKNLIFQKKIVIKFMIKHFTQKLINQN